MPTLGSDDWAGEGRLYSRGVQWFSHCLVHTWHGRRRRRRKNHGAERDKLLELLWAGTLK